MRELAEGGDFHFPTCSGAERKKKNQVIFFWSWRSHQTCSHGPVAASRRARLSRIDVVFLWGPLPGSALNPAAHSTGRQQRGQGQAAAPRCPGISVPWPLPWRFMPWHRVSKAEEGQAGRWEPHGGTESTGAGEDPMGGR